MFRNHCIQATESGAMPRGGTNGALTGHCEVLWHDRHDDRALSTGPLRRPAQPRCWKGTSRLGLIHCSDGVLPLRTDVTVTLGSLPHIIPTGTTLSHTRLPGNK